MKSFVTLACAGLLSATAAQAFEVTGGSVNIGYSSFTSETDVNRFALGGSLEVGITRQFAVQGDLSVTRFGLTDFSNTSFGLHAIGHLSDTTSVGGFIGADRFEGATLDFYGAEIGHQFGQLGAEAYLGHLDDSGTSGTVFGLKGDYALSDTASLGIRYNNVDLAGVDLSRLALTGEYAPTAGITLQGEIGSADLAGSGSEAFVGLGVKVNFGAKRGATFDQRSVTDLLPGF